MPPALTLRKVISGRRLLIVSAKILVCFNTHYSGNSGDEQGQKAVTAPNRNLCHVFFKKHTHKRTIQDDAYKVEHYNRHQSCKKFFSNHNYFFLIFVYDKDYTTFSESVQDVFVKNCQKKIFYFRAEYATIKTVSNLKKENGNGGSQHNNGQKY